MKTVVSLPDKIYLEEVEIGIKLVLGIK